MTDKLKRARHTHDHDAHSRQRPEQPSADLAASAACPSEPAVAKAEPTASAIDTTTPSPSGHDDDESEPQVGASAALISICTIISRITGLGRTWAMAFALGATFVSSSYQVANNLPNMLYELVMGGMLTTAFLPIYLSLRKQNGAQRSNDYASNLFSILVIVLGAVSVVCIVFAAQIIYTQTFYSDQGTMSLSVFLFRFFALQILFYGASSIFSGVLNANRDYLWGAIAPVANNVIVIAAFLLYAAVAPVSQELAFYVLGIGGSLGVFSQMAIQMPALRRNGIKLRFHIDLHDPALRETLSLGLPAVLVTLYAFAVTSVTNAASYCFADNGPSVIAYARLWFTFPHSFLAVSVSTAMFTELSSMYAAHNDRGVVKGIVSGSNQIVFLMVPFALYLIVYSVPLVTLYHTGAFTSDAIDQIASYLRVMAIALPFYSVNSYLQMSFSSIRKMNAFSVIMLVASILQIIIICTGAWAVQLGYPVTIESIAVGTIASYITSDVLAFAYLRRHYGTMGLKSTLIAFARALALGGAGAAVGWGVLMLLETGLGALNGSILQAFAYIVVSGIASLIATFAPAIKLNLPEALFVTQMVAKVAGKLCRNN